MKRALAIVVVIACAAAAAVVAGAGGETAGEKYKIVFDNAFGLTEGADFRVGGVVVGRIDDLDVERRTSRALVTASITKPGFAALREDVSCELNPQSLIGEYFVNCEPGQKGEVLQDGATIPVERTASPIPADLVTNVMRRPYRERFRIILDELGIGLAARGDDLNETIGRALPALRETQRVLKVLGDNRATLRQLTADSGRVLKVLGQRREDVGDFVVEARDAAETTASRREALQETLRRFPGFLDELEPTLADLGTAARLQAPAFADLRAAAPDVTRLLNTLAPFARASRPAVESLGDAARVGRRAVREAESTVDELGEIGRRAPEPANNLDLIVKDLDDRSRAVEKDPDSPTGQGYTGFEAILQYVFDQSLAINIFDQRGYSLKINALINECTSYTDAQEARENPERTAKCSAALGPSQPGVNQPDPSPPEPATAQRRATPRERTGPRPRRERRAADAPARDDDRRPQSGGGERPRLPEVPKLPKLPSLPELVDRLPGVLGLDGKRPQPQPSPSPEALLDFLLGS